MKNLSSKTHHVSISCIKYLGVQNYHILKYRPGGNHPEIPRRPPAGLYCYSAGGSTDNFWRDNIAGPHGLAQSQMVIRIESKNCQKQYYKIFTFIKVKLVIWDSQKVRKTVFNWSEVHLYRSNFLQNPYFRKLLDL